MCNRLATEPRRRRAAIRCGVFLAAAIGAVVPFLAHAAGDFSIGNAATFAQNIIEPDSAFRSGGTIPQPPAVTSDDFAGALPSDFGGAGAARVSGQPNSGQLADTAKDQSVPVTAKLPPPVDDPMTTSPRPSYRWQSLVPGVLK